MDKIEKTRENIRKTKNKIRELEEYLKTLQMREHQLCDEEVVRAMREMSGKNGDVMETLRRIRQADEHSKKKEEEEHSA